MDTRQYRKRLRKHHMDTDCVAAPPETAERSLLDRLRSASELLEQLAADRPLLNRLPPQDRERLCRAAAELYSPNALDRRRTLKKAGRARAAAASQRLGAVLQETGIRTLRQKPVFTTPNVYPSADPEISSGEQQDPEWSDSPHCYVCKQHYSTIHHFYDQLCPSCAKFNFDKRTELADLRGRVALLTGGRVKIGYQAGLKLLRAGARLIVTTRFPRNSAQRYAQEPDFPEWADRLEIYGLDLRHTPSVDGRVGS